MIIKQLTPTHCQEIGELHKKCFSNPWSNRSIKQSLENPNVLCFGAYKSECSNLAGVVMSSFLDYVDIYTICVQPEEQRLKIATKLFKHSLGVAKENNLQEMFLEVEHINAPAIMFYEKMLFQKIAERKHYYGQNRHAIVMKRPVFLKHSD